MNIMEMASYTDGLVANSNFLHLGCSLPSNDPRCLSFTKPKHPNAILPRSLSNLLDTNTSNARHGHRNSRDHTRLIPALNHSTLHPLLLLNTLPPLLRHPLQKRRTRMTGPHLTPRPIRLQLQPTPGHPADDLDVLGGLEAAAIDADVKAHVDQLEHLVQRAGEAVHDAAAGQGAQALAQQAREVGVRGARVQEQRQADLDGDVELRREVLQLDLFRAQREAVVVQAYLAEGDDWRGTAHAAVGLGEGAQGGEHGGRA